MPSITWLAPSMLETEECSTSAGYRHAGEGHHYRRAKTITLILDNYIIHKSMQTEQWLKKNPKFCLVFQSVYSPWVNHIEWLWHKLRNNHA